MKSKKSAGLVAAGGVNRSFLARLPALVERLGPIKGASHRVSSRIANAFRAGCGVADYAALEPCETIWIFVPEQQLDCVTAELAASVPLDRKIVVICDAMRDSLWPGPLLTSGARVATLNSIPETDERTFVAEGHALALAELRRLLALDGRRLIEIKPASKPLYFSGVHLGAHLILPWIASAVESFRAAGFTRPDAVRTATALGTRALRAYAKAGEKAWNAAAAERLHRAIERDLETIRLTDERLAEMHSGRILLSCQKPAQKQAGRKVVAMPVR
jgi:predicted short-subunit dehydrogenase-like oxidoreductase (DUF2520 family)